MKSIESIAPRLVVMGVSGCGKSAMGARLAQAMGLPLIEGDDFHSAPNVQKMRQGQPLTDADRADWLHELGRRLAQSEAGTVLTCSALKRDYRERLRLAAPGVRFVYLALTPAQAFERVATRPGHFYPPSLVDSQFEALQDPTGEPGVLPLDATLPLDQLAALAARWVAADFGQREGFEI